MNEENNTESGGNPEQQPQPTEKTFTQADVSRMMAKEKSTGENSVLKMLGLSSKDEVPAFMETHKNRQTQLEAATAELNLAKNKSILAEKGVDPNYADYVMYEANKFLDEKNADTAPDFGAAADKFLAEKPMYKQQTTVPAPFKFSTGAGQTTNAPPKTASEQINENIRNSIKK
ncbi:MAG: hypothetical protein FWF15_05155 [Oscillospiraceae bacterium]|nr:hypothetical protein [Oscillospiraceae bacterium]